MAKKLILFIIALFIGTIQIYALKNFVYVRCSPEDGNVSAIVKKIDEFYSQTSDSVVVFLSGEKDQWVATNEYEWGEMRSVILGMQVSFDFYPDEEFKKLDAYYVSLFCERICEGFEVKGINDDGWECSYIMPYRMYVSGDFEFFREHILVNQLSQRMRISVFTYDDSNDVIERNFKK